mmetsp:Transcript_82891/g.238214  ORF Transcript_82891/g.238214 Transcript_82891/m.238214 type:complete len:341 (+) Transcript_82891:93-1115(+)
MAAVWAWLPDAQTILQDLRFVSRAGQECMATFEGMPLWSCQNQRKTPVFWALANYPRALGLHWEIPLIAVAVYSTVLSILQHWIARRGKVQVRGFAFWWNVSLSVFSFAGVLACAPLLLTALSTNGLYFAICAPAEWYEVGTSGVFVLLFILSKLAELINNVLLVLSAKPTIPLHWWHHTTVLLYCWHSYAVQISTGIWFAVMNYVVHFIMYGYFAGMGTRFRKSFVRFAIYITFMQLLQMLVGIWVTIRAVMYQMEGKHCHVNRTNSVLGLSMYFSYFVLFGLLFISNYNYLVKGNGRNGIPKHERSVIRAVGRQMVQPPVDSGASDELGGLVEDKKLN